MAAEERLDIEVVGGSRHEKFRVAGPAHAFITLRTVGGNFKIVSLLAPDDVTVKLVHQRAGTRKSAGPGDVRMHYNARHRIDRGRHCQPPHLDITKTMKRK